MRMDLRREDVVRQEWDLEPDAPNDHNVQMSVLDAFNERYGRGTVEMDSAGQHGKDRSWTLFGIR